MSYKNSFIQYKVQCPTVSTWESAMEDNFNFISQFIPLSTLLIRNGSGYKAGLAAVGLLG